MQFDIFIFGRRSLAKNDLVFIKCINSESAVQSLSAQFPPFFLTCNRDSSFSREEIQPEDCFDIVGQSPGKLFCSATKGVLDSEQRLLS